MRHQSIRTRLSYLLNIILFKVNNEPKPAKTIINEHKISSAIDFSEVVKIPGFGRIKINDRNIVSIKYRALDLADWHTKRINLNDSRELIHYSTKLCEIRVHTTNLYQTLRNLKLNDDFHDCAGCDFDWDAVCYNLQMAASVEDVYADTSVVDDSGSVAYCRPAAEFEAAHSESASKYMAAQIFFNFVWTAYEIAVDLSAFGITIKKKTGAKGRVLIGHSKFQSYHFPKIRKVYADLLESCMADKSIHSTKDIIHLIGMTECSTPEQSAEIVRIIRNRVMHGDEPVPYPEDHGGWSENSIAHPCHRLYLTARLTLILIQALALLCVKDRLALAISPYEDEFDEDDNRQNIDFTLRNLHTFNLFTHEDQLKIQFQ